MLLTCLGACEDGDVTASDQGDELAQIGNLPVPNLPGLPQTTPPGSPVPPGGACPSELAGWATIAGDGVTATTGGGATPPVRPKTAAELTALAGDAQPRVIEIAGTFSIPTLNVGSNKTLIGVGPGATIRGGVQIKGNKSAPVRNVIIKNIHVNGGTSQASGDAVHLEFAHHVWLDHLDIYDGPDGSLDMTHAVNWVTVSWTKVRYTPAYRPAPGEEVAQHRFASLIGHSDDNAAEDTGRLKVTFHHNFWAEGILERMPRVRFGQVHVFNNLFAASGNNYAVRAGRGAQVLVESNYFDNIKNPHVFNNENDKKTANITARNNSYNGGSGERATGGGGPAFVNPPYRAVIEPPAALPPAIRRCAGPH